jgi:ureidoacrylate peracid hydrolase
MTKHFGVIPGLNRSELALLVVDMQNDFIHPDGIFAKNGFGGEYRKVIEKNAEVAELCKANNIPVIYTRQVMTRNRQGESVDSYNILQIRPFLKKAGLTLGTWGAEVIQDLPEPDYTIDKQRFSAFYNTHLERLLFGLGVKQLLVTGVVSCLCVEHTFRDAWIRDYQTWLVEDCCGAFADAFHQPTVQIATMLGNLTDSESLRNTLSPSAKEEFSV